MSTTVFHKTNLIIPVLIGVLCTIIRCSNPVAGGGTLGGNPVVYGKVVHSDGSAAAHTFVGIFPHSYDPVNDSARTDIHSDTTDLKGFFQVTLPDTGVYTLFAMDAPTNTRSILREMHIESQKSTIPDATLEPEGHITVTLGSLIDKVNGYLYIPGTSTYTFLDGKSVVTMNVPADTALPLYYSVDSQVENQPVLVTRVIVQPEQTVKLTWDGWKFTTRITLNTSAGGADTKEKIGMFPVLIRLSNDNFDFSTAMQQGEDCIFVRDDGTLLPYEIECWDQVSGHAEVWVKIDEILPQNDTQFFLMHWGGVTNPLTSNSAAVFDTANGFQAVFHMTDKRNDTIVDATINRYDGTPTDFTSTSGIIGKSGVFNGTSTIVRLPGTSSGKLNFPAQGNYTISAWVHLDSITSGGNHQIISKGKYQYLLRTQFANWEFAEFRESRLNGWYLLTTPYTQHSWIHLAGVNKGTSQYLYLNGVCVDSTSEVDEDAGVRNSGYDVEIGGRSGLSGGTTGQYFNGSIDEVRLSDISRGPEWIRLTYVNQKGDHPFVVFDK